MSAAVSFAAAPASASQVFEAEATPIGIQTLVTGVAPITPAQRLALRTGTQDTVNQAGQQIVRRQLNVAPTLTIRSGFSLRVIVTRDLILAPMGSAQ